MISGLLIVGGLFQLVGFLLLYSAIQEYRLTHMPMGKGFDSYNMRPADEKTEGLEQVIGPNLTGVHHPIKEKAGLICNIGGLTMIILDSILRSFST